MDKSYRRDFAAVAAEAREAQTDDAQGFFGIDVGTDTLIAIDGELTRLEAIEAAARAYIKASDHEGADYRSVEQQIDDIEAVYLAYDVLKAAVEAGDDKRD